ncbi:RICIN domain-containing protein [Amycolatopsis sp. WQ 127309]|uniref:RICIN domain-containing protein n=1 Tax=Amycolatopsis sp. WQ 127309 TaxID=2932773 RepID=UPI001FF69EC8|nr:RICIN domain-containing protein [Amycolatopsis sp. WQ 127309]
MLRSGWNDRCLEPDQNGLFTDGDKAQLWDCGGIALEAFSITKNPEGFYRFQNAYSGRYLEASKTAPGGGVNGTKAQLWDFVAGATNQWWH